MSLDADVVIVGGGPAGLSTALFLTAAEPSLTGRVCVLERDAYPRDKPCAGALGGRADRLLARIGVEVDVPSAPIRGVAVSVSGGRVGRREREERIVGRVVERAAFDARLAEIVAQRGVRVCQRVRVRGLEQRADRAIVHTEQGSLSARFVVGADGVGSVVRRSFGPVIQSMRAQVVEVDTELLDSDIARDELHFDASDPGLDGYVWDFPVAGERGRVCRGAYVLKVPGRSPPDAGAVLDRHLRKLGLDPASYPRKRFAERAFSARTKLSRGRCLLVGEAAGVDPVSGEGIAQAIGYGAVAGPFLADRVARRIFHADGFASRLAASAVGLDLHGRAGLARLFFGERRAFYEGALKQVPETLELGLEYFGGLAMHPLRLARVVARGGCLELFALLGRARGGSRIGAQQEQVGVAGADQFLVAQHHGLPKVPADEQLARSGQTQGVHLIVERAAEASTPAVLEGR